MLVLPWFIWEEVIDYTIQVGPQYCLVNKEWFEYSAGRIITLNSAKLCNNVSPSSWLKFAETLELTDFSNINWDFLLECRKFKHISLDFRQLWDINYKSLKEVISCSQIQSLVIKFDDNPTKEQSILILEKVSPKIESLDIDSDLFSYSYLPYIFYPKVKKFKVYNYEHVICVDSLDKSMPNLEDLSICSFIEFNLIPAGKTIFKNLISLSLGLNWFRFEDKETINSLFSFNFPNLTSCQLDDTFKVYSPKRIPLSMPKLKKLQFYLVTTSDSNDSFPSKTMLHLKELSLNCEKENLEIGAEEDGYNFETSTDPVCLNLSNLPSLTNVNVSGKVKFINHNGNFSNLPHILFNNVFMKGIPFA